MGADVSPVSYTHLDVYKRQTYFEHQDWLGTERLRTTYNGGVEGSYTSLPFGDDLPTSPGGGPLSADTGANHFATLDHLSLIHI